MAKRLGVRVPSGGGRLVQAIVLVALGALLGGLSGLVFYVSDLVEAVPAVTVPGTPVRILPVDVVFVAGFVGTVLVGVAYLALQEHDRDVVSNLQERWAGLPDIVKAIVVGLLVALVAEFSVALVDVYAFQNALPDVSSLVVFLLVWLAVTLLDLRRRRRTGGGFLSTLLVESGFAQIQRLQTVTVALAVGFLFAIVVDLLVVQVADDSGFALVAGTFVLVFVVATVVAFKLLSGAGVRTDLVITNVRERTSNRSRELSIRNDGDERIDLREARIRDTEYDLYRTNMDVVLVSGQTGKFTIPPEFALFPSENTLGIDMPFGFTISQGADAPMIVTRDGKEFELQFADESDDGGADTEQGAIRPDA